MMKRRRLLGVSAVLVIAWSAVPRATQDRQLTEEQRKAQELRDYIRAHYTKSEHMVPMRDGKRLFVAVYAPKDVSERYPIWMQRTPYTVAPYGVDNYRGSLGPSELFAREGYIFAYCDVRGCGKSEGKFEHVRPYIPNKTAPSEVDEASDTYDTIEFLLKTIPNHNGRVGISGTSYPGFYATMAALSGHPALKAVSPQAPVTEWFIGDDFRHNGALFLAHAFGFFSSFGRPRPGENEVPGPRFDYGTPDGYEFFLNLGGLANADEKYFKHTHPYWTLNVEHTTYDERLGRIVNNNFADYHVPTNAELAANLKGHLLLVHGEIDNNVHPANTMRLVDALIKANKRFDMLVIPGVRHGYGDRSAYFNWVRSDYFCKYLLGQSADSVDIVELNKEKEQTGDKKPRS